MSQLTVVAHKTDAKIMQLMESSASQRLPGLKQLARRFNSLRDTLAQEAAKRGLNVCIPLAVDVDRLFDTDANPAMWMEEGQIRQSASPPGYMTDPSVQQGIGALLVQDRGEEESNRLGHELKTLVKWISQNLKKVEAAISFCKGKQDRLQRLRREAEILF